MAGCGLCKCLAVRGKLLSKMEICLGEQVRPAMFTRSGSLRSSFLGAGSLRSERLDERRGSVVSASSRRPSRLAVCASSSATAGYPSDQSWNSNPKTLDSLSNFIPLPGKPGHSPKRRYIAGVDQTDRVDPWLLADKDSRFAEFYGVQLHYKLARPPSGDGASSTNPANALGKETGAMSVPAILLHGFGASLFSWSRILKPLAAVIGSQVVAFDRPAFGLTSRPQTKAGVAEGSNATPELNPYSLEFSVAATLSFVEFLHAQQVVLMGHSAGCLVALQAYLDAPEKVAALVLVAPALAPPIILDEIQQAVTAQDPETSDSQKTQPEAGAKKSGLGTLVMAVRAAIWWSLMQIFYAVRIIKAAVQALFETLVPGRIVEAMGTAIRRAHEKILRTIIRSPPAIWTARVVMDRFGTRAVRMAFCDPKKADNFVLNGYTKPLRSKDWERALLEFALAIAVNPATGVQPKSPLGRRLKEVKCPVLVITGDTDRLVPAWNARRLANALPNSEFAVVKQCGHMPHEETPEEFLSLVEIFIAKNFMNKSVSLHTHVPT